MYDLSKQVIGSPFDEVHNRAFEFALSMQEDALFNKLYSEPSTREAAINYLITSPKIYQQRPN